jgi:AraC-like DNA-binding protein
MPLVGQVSTVRSHTARPISWHAHEGYELIFLLDGEMSYETRSAPAISIKGGSFCIFPPGELHRGLNSVGSPSTLLGIECRPDRPDAASLTTLAGDNLLQIQRLIATSTMKVHPFSINLRRGITRLFKLVEEYSTKTLAPTEEARDQAAGQKLAPLTQACLRTACCAVLIDTASELASPPQPDHDAIVKAAIRYLEQHCCDSPRIADLTKHLGYSRARVFELFKAGTGMTPNDYLLRLRIRKASELLSDSETSITDIAFRTGFSSSQNFSKVFKKYTGMMPSRYRDERRYTL